MTVLRVQKLFFSFCVCVRVRAPYSLGPEVLVVLRVGKIIIYFGSTIRGSSLIDWRRIGRIKVCPSDPATKRVVPWVSREALQIPPAPCRFLHKGIQTKEWNTKDDIVADLLHKAARASETAKRMKGRFIDRIQEPGNANWRWPRQDTLLTVSQWLVLIFIVGRKHEMHSGTVHALSCAHLCNTDYPFKDEAQTALFKDPVRTAQ